MKKWPLLRQKILYLAAGIFVLLNLFPPWKTYTNPPLYDVSQFIGYRFILSPPLSPLDFESYVVIDYPILFLEWIVFFVFLILAFRLTKKTNQKNQ